MIPEAAQLLLWLAVFELLLLIKLVIWGFCYRIDRVVELMGCIGEVKANIDFKLKYWMIGLSD